MQSSNSNPFSSSPGGDSEVIESQPPYQRPSLQPVSRNLETRPMQLVVQPARVRQRKMLFWNTGNNIKSPTAAVKSAKEPNPLNTQKAHSPNKPANTTTMTQPTRRVIPKEIEVQSVISEEEDDILSTGGARDDDGINLNVVFFRSSIQSVRRQLQSASNVEEVNAVAIQSVSNSGSSQSRVQPYQTQYTSQQSPLRYYKLSTQTNQDIQPQQIVDYLQINQTSMQSRIDTDITPAFIQANATNELQYDQQEANREQLVSVAIITESDAFEGQVRMESAESEVEVNFYSEGLSNHATSYRPSQFEMQSNANPRQTFGGNSHGFGSVIQSQVSNDPGEAIHTESYSPPFTQRNRLQTTVQRPSGQNRLIMVNDLASNGSSQQEGDTGGQRPPKKALFNFQTAIRREHSGSQETQQNPFTVRASQAGAAYQSSLINSTRRTGGGHQRIRSTEDACGLSQNHIVRKSHFPPLPPAEELIEPDSPAQVTFASLVQEAANRPRKDSSGGTKTTQLQARLRQASNNNRHAPGEANRNLQRMLTPESENAPKAPLLWVVDNSKLDADASSPVSEPSLRVSPSCKKENSKPQTQPSLQPQDIVSSQSQSIYDLCQFLNHGQTVASNSSGRRVLNAMTTSKEARKRQQIRDQSHHSYYNKSNNSTPRKISPEFTKVKQQSQSTESRQHQLLSYTVDTLATHQKFQYSTERSPLGKAPAPRRPELSVCTTGVTLNTTLRLENIFNAILEKSTNNKAIVLRKLGMWALCLIVLVPKQMLQQLPAELCKELGFFKDEIDNNNPFGGKVQMNPIPEAIKLMINEDANQILRLRDDDHKLKYDQRIWTFPCFETEVLDHAEMGLLEISEALPDPQDYCIGVHVDVEVAVTKQRSNITSPAKDSDILFYLDSRLDQELKKSVKTDRSQSPRWMQEKVQNPGSRKLGMKKSSAYTSKERTNNTIDSMMEVPDEAYNDIRDFTDIELNAGSGHQSKKSSPSTKKPIAAIRKKVPAQNSKTPGQSVLTSKIRQASPRSFINSNKGGMIHSTVKNPGLAVKSNWQRSITTIAKYPQKSSLGSGRKTATTKLNYGYAAANGVSSGDKKRSQEDIEFMSQTAPSASHRKTTKVSQSTNMTISSLIKSMADKTSLLRVPNTNTSQACVKTKQLQLTQRQMPAKAGESLDIRKASSGQKSTKANSSRNHKTRLSPNRAMNPSSVANHARSFAMKKQPGSANSINKTAADSQSRRRQKTFIQQAALNSVAAMSPAGSANSSTNYRLTQQLPQSSHRSKMQQRNSQTRPKTSLESHLVSRVMTNNQRAMQEERKGPPTHQALITLNKQRRQQTELSQIIKLASDMKSSQQYQPTAPQTTRRRKTEGQNSSFQSMKLGSQTERQRRPTRPECMATSKGPSCATSSNSSAKLLEQIDEHTTASQAVAVSATQSKSIHQEKMNTTARLNEPRHTNLSSQLQMKLMLPQDRISQTPSTKISTKISFVKSPPDLKQSSRYNISLRSSLTGTGMGSLRQPQPEVLKSFSQAMTSPPKHNLKQLLQPVPSSRSSSKHSIRNRVISSTPQPPQPQLSTSSTKKLSARSMTGCQPKNTILEPIAILPKTFIQL